MLNGKQPEYGCNIPITVLFACKYCGVRANGRVCRARLQRYNFVSDNYPNFTRMNAGFLMYTQARNLQYCIDKYASLSKVEVNRVCSGDIMNMTALRYQFHNVPNPNSVYFDLT